MVNKYSYNSYDKSVNVPFFMFQGGNINLTEIPPKYIESIEIERLQQDFSGKFTLNLVLPVSTFEQGANELFIGLTSLLGIINGQEDENTRFDFEYGWQGGPILHMQGATISSATATVSSSFESINYKICGVSYRIIDKFFEKGLYCIDKYYEDVLQEAADTLGYDLSYNYFTGEISATPYIRNPENTAGSTIFFPLEEYVKDDIFFICGANNYPSKAIAKDIIAENYSFMYFGDFYYDNSASSMGTLYGLSTYGKTVSVNKLSSGKVYITDLDYDNCFKTYTLYENILIYRINLSNYDNTQIIVKHEDIKYESGKGYYVECDDLGFIYSYLDYEYEYIDSNNMAYADNGNTLYVHSKKFDVNKYVKRYEFGQNFCNDATYYTKDKQNSVTISYILGTNPNCNAELYLKSDKNYYDSLQKPSTGLGIVANKPDSELPCGYLKSLDKDYFVAKDIDISDSAYNSATTVYNYPNGNEYIFYKAFLIDVAKNTGKLFNSYEQKGVYVRNTSLGTSPYVIPKETSLYDVVLYNNDELSWFKFNSIVKQVEENLATEEENLQNKLNTLFRNNSSITLFSEEHSRISDLIENLANYLFDDTGFTVTVDHVDKVYDITTKLEDISNAFTNINGSSKTLKQYLDDLIRVCCRDVDYSNRLDLSKYKLGNIYTINGKSYMLITDIDEDYVEATASFYDITELDAIGRKNLLEYLNISTSTGDYFQPGKFQDYHSGDSDIPFDFLDIVDFDLYEIARLSPNNAYIMHVDFYNKIVHIGPRSNVESIDEYIISNNIEESDVLSFNLSANAFAGITAIQSIRTGTTTTADLLTGLGIIGSTDTGGGVSFTKEQLNSLIENFSGVLTANLGNGLSEGTIQVWGSEKTINLNIGSSVVRIVPSINNGKLLWEGDYLVMSIKDVIDSNGFITSMTVQFKDSAWYSRWEDELLGVIHID